MVSDGQLWLGVISYSYGMVMASYVRDDQLWLVRVSYG